MNDMANKSITITTMDSQMVWNKLAKKKISKHEVEYFKRVIAMINEAYKNGRKS